MATEATKTSLADDSVESSIDPPTPEEGGSSEDECEKGMSFGSPLPPLIARREADKPLDLSVKRGDMGDQMGPGSQDGDQRSYDRRHSLPTGVLSSDQMRPTASYPDFSSVGQSFDSKHVGRDSPPYFTPAASANSGVTSFCPDGAYESSRSPLPAQVNYDNVHPKKRKNLWRPYDTEFEEEKDSDSSDSLSSSDQEGKPGIEAKMDPMKKRKMDMLKYASSLERLDNIERTVPSPESDMTEASSTRKTSNWELGSSSNEAFAFSGINEDIAKAQMALFSSYPESREKLISGMKKRDIFGWSLKLSKDSPAAGDIKSELEASSSPEPGSNLCHDGDKTYFELQTVKKQDSSSPSSSSSLSSSPERKSPSPVKTPTRQTRSPVDRKPTSSPVQVKMEDGRKQARSQSSVKVEKDDLNEPKKVTVQGRSDVVGQWKDPVEKKKATFQSLSLIDLVEEIEAEALKAKEKPQNKPKNRNNGIAALLKQCDNVKLTALDFLMSNVLLQEKEQPYKAKNARVQQMLKGDKINSVSMLDIVELQVEVGLS